MKIDGAIEGRNVMAGFPATCDKCGYKLKDVHETCPNCGPAPKTAHLEARTQIGLSARVSMTTRKIEEEIKKNWPLIGVLVLGDGLSTIPAYCLSGWQSVAVTIGFIVFSTVVGYYAITRVITITTETH
jgi:hypothetical protein